MYQQELLNTIKSLKLRMDQKFIELEGRMEQNISDLEDKMNQALAVQDTKETIVWTAWKHKSTPDLML